MKVRVAAVQAESQPGKLDANIVRAVELVRVAAADDARLVVFPEAFPTGYDMSVFRGRLPSLEDLSWLAPLQSAVDTLGVHVVLNTPLEQEGSRYLSDVLLAPGAAPLRAYDKQHLYPDERRIFAPGAHGCSLDIDGFTVALSVCYDANFPEHAAAAAAAGATVYVNSGAYYPRGARRRDLHYGARALDNGIFVVFSGLIGAPSRFIGGSAVFDPEGTRVARCSTREGIAVAEIDADRVAEIRARQQMWRDRRASLGNVVAYRLTDNIAGRRQ